VGVRLCRCCGVAGHARAISGPAATCDRAGPGMPWTSTDLWPARPCRNGGAGRFVGFELWSNPLAPPITT